MDIFGNMKKYKNTMCKDNYGWCNNFKGFIQYRYLIENEYD